MTALELTTQFAQSHELPTSFIETATEFYFPLAQEIAQQSLLTKKPLTIGLHGCQGSGKSTLTDYLLFLLDQHFNLPSVGLSIDDFYLTSAERLQLAHAIHPLLKTRGVPGTHDIPLLNRTLAALATFESPVIIPRFNKAIDDRFEPSHWTNVTVAPKVVILEGWCVGASPQSSEQLAAPVNALEREEDPDGLWRGYVNDALAHEYQSLFNSLDRLVFLQAPGFYTVKSWRLQQEEKLRQKVLREGKPMTGVMNEAQVERFIQHYQRITEHCLALLPSIANDIFVLNEDRQIVAVNQKGERTV